MRIGFDVSQTGEDKAGCGFFADQLIRALAEEDSENEYRLYPTFYGYRSFLFEQATRIEKPNFATMFGQWPFEAQCLWWDTVQDRMEALGAPDIIHANNYSCPRDVPAKVVFTVYDLAVLEVPQYTTEENRLVCFQGLFDAAMRADHLIMISEATRRAFIRHFPHYPEDRMTVIHLGNRPTIVPRTAADCRDYLAELGVSREGFWLGVGTVEPRKNYRLLIDAYKAVVNRGEDERPLLIAGGKGWLESDIGNFVHANGLADKVRFLGYVTDEQLSMLYSSCFAFVYPSFYEGFGLPVLEAMSCGAAVICSNSTSLPEVAGDAALLIDPKSSRSLQQAMQELLHSRESVCRLRKAGAAQASKFSWRKAAQETLRVYGIVNNCSKYSQVK